MSKLKKVLFAAIVISLIIAIAIVLKAGKLTGLEGYMYSLASELTEATPSDATSSNATSSNATSSNATSSNATNTNIYTYEEKEEELEEVIDDEESAVTTFVPTDSEKIKQSEEVESVKEVEPDEITTETVTTGAKKTPKKEVSYLESNRTYILTIGIGAGVAAIVVVILGMDIANSKLKAAKKAQNEESKVEEQKTEEPNDEEDNK